jgi:hypothetical protein
VRNCVCPLAAALLICACSADAEDRSQTSTSSDTAPGDIASLDTEPLDISAPDASPQDTATTDTTGDDAATDSDAADANSDESVHFGITSPRSDQPVEYRLHVVTEPAKVRFIASAVEIAPGDFPDSPSIEVPAGDRGVDGSEGARLNADKRPGSDWQGSDTIRVRDDGRITGLHIEGPIPNRDMNWLGDDHDYTDGIDVGDASGIEIDNNELFGWPYAAVSGGNPVYVYHNVIHDNDQRGLGYGVSGSHRDSTIEYNRFERNRHAVAGSGAAGEGYIVRHNDFGAEGIGGAGHKIDMHEEPDCAGDAGTRIEI